MSSHTPRYALADSLEPETLAQTFPDYDDQLVARTVQEASDGLFEDPESVLPANLADNLDNDLYSHQADALAALQDGDNVTVATSTSSGKTWIYTLYFALLKQQNPDARALFLYPTKALSTDQEKAVNDLFNDLGVDATAETYDGDTKSGRKPIIRDKKDGVMSNFSCINEYLSNRVKWNDVYENCVLSVIDESHTYTGVHGMHVAWVIRRLRRMLNHYDADPQIVCSTATIGNPKEHSESLTGAEFTVIDNDGSPHGRREIAFWQPPVDKENDGHGYIPEDEVVPDMRKRAGSEAARVTAHLGLNGVQTLTFTRSRQGTEIGAKQAGSAAGDHPSDEYLRVKPYHAGLSKKKRRGVEHQLKSGETDAVITTNALELGIDIGGVDATVLAGYPGTRQSFWQQVGRAGRGGSDSLSVFIPRSDAIDQYILDDPDYLLSDDVEDAVVDLENNAVYARHVLCAANESPLTEDDVEWFGPRDRLERAVSVWQDAGRMVGDLDRGAQYNGAPRPQSDISMYATTDELYDVRCTNGDIDMEPIEKKRAYRDYHPGALVMYDGQQYEVTDIHEDRYQPYVEVQRVNTREYTITLSDKRVHDLEVKESRDLGGGFSIHKGMGTVDVAYTQYKRMDIDGGHASSGMMPIDLPPVSLRTQLMWIELPNRMLPEVEAAVNDEEYIEPSEDSEFAGMSPARFTVAGGLHGAEHGMIKMAPLELRLDNSDMGGLSMPMHPETESPVWFIHDAVEGGVGRDRHGHAEEALELRRFSYSIYENFEEIALKTLARVEHCSCGRVEGCPSCLMSSQCGNNNEPLHRKATQFILDEVLYHATE